jgi:transcriptional regulator with XRE-family HTH domain
MSQFAASLNAAIDAVGLSAAELAVKAGLTESAISLLRSGRREPSYRTLQRLTSVLPQLAPASSERESPFDSIEDAIEDIRAGKMVVVLDDEDRENEGDLVMAAEKVTAEAINFMRKEGGGLICVPVLGSRLDELQIPQMVRDNTAVHETDQKTAGSGCDARRFLASRPYVSAARARGRRACARRTDRSLG